MAAKNKSTTIGTMDLVLFALLQCGGDQKFISTDEVALQAFRLFPGKFCWDTFPHLPHWDRVRQWLSEAKKEKHGRLVEGYSGERREGWRLTAAGLRMLKFRKEALAGVETAALIGEDYVSAAPALLVTFVAQESRAQGGASFLKLVETSFMRFPRVFGMQDYPGWPDSGTVREALDKASEAGYMERKADTGQFVVTERGIRESARIGAMAGRSARIVRLEEIGKGLVEKASKQIALVTKSDAWEMHKAGRPFSKAVACEAIGCSLQSHPRALRRVLEDLQYAAEQMDRTDVQEFLALCTAKIGVEAENVRPVNEGGSNNGARNQNEVQGL